MAVTARAPSAVGLRSERGPLLLALLLSLALVALDSTIIATAVPSIVAGIGGFAQFPWLFSVYLLAQAVTVPVYGKLADLFGRKPMMLIGIGLFLGGSVGCGLAWNIAVLIAFRAVQGLGAGAIQPMCMTIVGDIYSIDERAKVQGYLASVWGIAAVVGPTLGGVFSEYISWRWIFFVNIPVCLLAGWMIAAKFREHVPRSSPKVDYRGAVLMVTGLSLVILGLLEGGQAWAWVSPTSVVVLVSGVTLLVLFVLAERDIPAPMVPLWVFRRRLLATTSVTAFGVGAVVLGLTSYVPTFVQDVLGHGPLVGGFALATLTVGWPLTASFASRVYRRLGVRDCALLGCGFVVAGAALLLLLNRSSSVVEVGVFCFIIGAGLGIIAAPTLIAAQATVEWHERGVVTGMNMFSRSLGSALGVAAFGAVANGVLGSSAVSAHHDPARLQHAVHYVFLAVVAMAAVMTLGVRLMPRVRLGDPAPPAADPVAPATSAPAAGVAVAPADSVPKPRGGGLTHQSVQAADASAGPGDR